jgi:hypothetical protein
VKLLKSMIGPEALRIQIGGEADASERRFREREEPSGYYYRLFATTVESFSVQA